MSERTARLSFSSELEADRWFGGEILDHGQRSVRMGFMGSGNAPLLLHHDQRQIVGVVQTASVGSDRRGYAEVRFGRSDLAERAMQDVADGILRNVSVGYRIHKMALDRQDGDREVYRVTDWEPLEASLVSIPVDPTVGVGRGLETETPVDPPNPSTEIRSMTTEIQAAPAAPPAPAPAEPRIDVAGASRAAADAERVRIREIQALASRHNLGALGGEHVDRGTSLEEFRGVVLGELDKRGSTKPLAPMAGDLNLTPSERKRYSLSRAITALADSIKDKKPFSGFERELSDEIAKRNEKDPQGFYVPYDLFGVRQVEDGPVSMFQRTLTSSGGVATGGALVQTTVLASQYVPPNYNIPVVVQAGARLLPGLQGNVQIPAMTAGKAGTWVNPENTSVTAADPTFAQIALSPKDVGTVVDISRRLLLQSNPAVDGLLRDDIATAIGLALDAGALTGTGASGQPTGLLNNSNIGIQAGGANGAALTWANVTYLPQLVATANRLSGGLGFIASAAAFYHATRTVKATGYPVYLAQYEENKGVTNGANAGSMLGYPVHVSQQIPANLTKGAGTNLSAIVFGQWSDLLIGEWGVLDMLVDPYTFSNTGAIRIRAFLTADVNVRYAGSFATIKDIVTT